MVMFTQKPFYLAGPMSGIPRFNFPMFDRVAKILRDSGWAIISPAELDSPLEREFAMQSPDGNVDKHEKRVGQTWGDLLSRDVKLVADECGGIILLPGWEISRGARLEAFVALLCGHTFFQWDEQHQQALPTTVEVITAKLL
jgi:hypothetical protein